MPVPLQLLDHLLQLAIAEERDEALPPLGPVVAAPDVHPVADPGAVVRAINPRGAYLDGDGGGTGDESCMVELLQLF